MEATILLTRQDSRSHEILDSEGVFKIKKAYIVEQFRSIASHYLQAYDWLVEEMEKSQ